MRVRFKIHKINPIVLDEKTHTVGDTQYWSRQGKYYSWTANGGKKEISSDEYYKALDGVVKDPSKRVKKELPKVKDKSEYKSMDNETLVDYIQNNDDTDAADRFIQNYEPLCIKLTNKYFLDGGGDKDDLMQTAREAVWDAAKTYDPEKGDLHRHVTNVVDTWLKSHLSSMNTQNRQKDTYATSMDATLKGKDGDDDTTVGDTIADKSPSIEDEYIGNERAKQLMNFINTELAPKEKDAILRFINGQKIPDIASETGVSYKSIENAIMRARNKIRQYHEEYMGESVDPNTNDNDEVDESEFTFNNHKYRSNWGRYSMDDEPITKDEYHQARRAMINSDDDGPLARIMNMPAKMSAARIDKFNDFANSLEYDKEYDVPRDTRDHLPRISKDDIDLRVESIMSDTGMNKDDAKRVNSIISDYTSKDEIVIAGDEKKLLDKYLDSAPVYDGIPLYRGMGFNETDPVKMETYKAIRDIPVGETMKLRGYTSFSSNEDIALNFAERKGDLQVFIVCTKNLSAPSIDHLSALDYNEDEVLFKQSTNLKVLKKEIQGSTVYLQVEEVMLSEDDDDPIMIDLGGSMVITPKATDECNN